MSATDVIFNATAENFQASVIDASNEAPVLVDFWASWCGPCKSLLPIVEKLAQDYAGAFRLAKVNIDEQQALAQQFAVRSVPTVKLVKNGQIVDEFMGALPESAIREFLDRHIETEVDKNLAVLLSQYQSGQTDDAILQIQALLDANPEHIGIKQQLADILIQQQRLDDAANILRSLPMDKQLEPQTAALLARLELMKTANDAPAMQELIKRLEQAPDNCEARYQLSSQYILQEDYEAALEQLLEILKRDRKYNDDAGRKGMLKVFEILGNTHPLVSQYRKRMTAALF